MKRRGGWLFQRGTPSLSLPLTVHLSTYLSVCSPHDATPIRRVSPPSAPSCSPVCVCRWYNDGVASDDSLMRLNINSHFVDAPLLHFSGIFFPRGIVGRVCQTNTAGDVHPSALTHLIDG